MATAKKLPSGSYRIRVYDNRSKQTKSFTASTKREAERLAAEWLATPVTDDTSDLTIQQAAKEYIEAKRAVLSPTTIAGYETILRNNLTRLLDMKLSELNVRTMQDWVNDLALSKSPKTVHNVYGFFTAILSYSDCELSLSKIRLPAKVKHFKRLPTAEVIIHAFRGSDIELPVLLGLWCGLRMSEIRGIRRCDITDDVLTINQVAITVNNDTVIKENGKTYNSKRQLKLAPMIMELVEATGAKDKDLLVPLTSSCLRGRFVRKMKKAGYNITFHDLRHVNASVMAALGVPDIYAMERGGWSNTTTLKSVYQQTFDDNRKRIDATIDDYFSKMFDTKFATNSLTALKKCE